MPIREAGVQICEDVPDFREERLTAGRVASIDLVVRDWRSAVRSRRGPDEGDCRIPRSRPQPLRGARDRGWRIRGGRGLVRKRALSDGVRCADLIIVRDSVRDRQIDVRRDERSAHEHEREDPDGPEEAGPVGFPRELGIATPDWVGHGEDTTSPRAYLSRLASNTNEPRGRSRNTASTHAFQRQWGPRP